MHGGSGCSGEGELTEAGPLQSPIKRGALQNQTPPRKEQVAWVREKIPLDFGFRKKPFELKIPRFASLFYGVYCINFFLFGSKIDFLYQL